VKGIGCIIASLGAANGIPLHKERRTKPGKKPLAVFLAAFSVILGSLAIATPLFAASSEKVLYNFCSADHCTDGSGPLSGLTFDNDGNLYGTTYTGGAAQSCEAGVAPFSS
jgi:hypothetical protein